jgi:nicotinic acid mononucleotide adenylyltransferase
LSHDKLRAGDRLSVANNDLSAKIDQMETTDELAIRNLVKTIHDSPGRVMLVAAGAGTRALAWLLGVAGASRTLLEALTPYDESSFDDFLGRKPSKYVEARTAGLLAGRALVRAGRLYQGSEPVIGLASTATIITDRPKRGQHRAHVAAWTARSVDRYSLYLHKGARDRRGEEEMVSRVIMNALARAYGLDLELPLPLLEGDRLARKLLDDEMSFFGIRADGRRIRQRYSASAVLSGAFNPLHSGHLGLAKAAEKILDREVIFELAAVNADKTALSVDQIQRRLLQFAGQNPVLVSNAFLFTSKAEIYPGAIFVVGVDTAERILQPRFYGQSSDKLLQALRAIREKGCRFLVAGRMDENGNYRLATELNYPDEFSDLFMPIPGDQFRIDISSTRIRAESV